MSDEQEAGENGASRVAASSLPAYLRIEPQYGIVTCTEHRTAYTPINLATHLVNIHKASKSVRDEVQQCIVDAHVASQVTEPPHGSAPIPGLQVHTGWQCTVNDCNELSQSLSLVGKHCSKEHGINSKRKREERSAVVQVSIQKWFAKSNKYWIVRLRAASPPPPPSRSTATPQRSVYISSPFHPPTSPFNRDHADTPRHSTVPPSVPSRVSTPVSTPVSLSVPPSVPTHIFTSTLEEITRDERHIRRLFNEAEHPSEITPWMRQSGYYRHFAQVDKDLIAPLLAVPRKSADQLQLFLIIRSVHRLLTTGHGQVRNLHPVVARHLNSFESKRVSQDPFSTMQNLRSLETYITTFQQLFCYIYRLSSDDPFERRILDLTPSQQKAWDDMLQHADTLHTYLTANGLDADGDADEEDADRCRLQRQLDLGTLTWTFTLLEHRTGRDIFDNAVMSFCAAASWSPGNSTWKSENQSAVVFSRLIYCCQLMIIMQAEDQTSDDDAFASHIRRWCMTWMNGDEAKGPLGDMLRLRLYAMHVAKDVVHPAQIRWRSDHHTLMYRDITYRIGDLATEISFCLDQARAIFQRDLCFDLPDIPTFALRELEDNWDEQAPGHSFLHDIRNTGVIDDHRDWLMMQISRREDLYRMVVQHDPDQDTTGHQVRSIFAQEYEVAVQQFLGYLSVLMHKGSGQPGRSTEFLGTRWQNKWEGGATRNIFVHDGYLLFLLTYHKAESRTHASRFPVRFLLPEVGHLLVQFLTLIMPFRKVLSKQVQIPAKVSEYLWHDGRDIWSGDRFMRFARTVSQQAHGVPVSMQSWRQIAVAIAVKKFGGLDYQADLDLQGDADDDVGGQSILASWGGAMADVFHLQAAHSVTTGNRIYGGSVNFDRGLTDAGLQEYFKASRLWHQLCRPAVIPPRAGHRRQASQPVPAVHSALRQRLAYRQRPTRHRLCWGREEVHAAFRQLFREADVVAYRSVSQEQLIEAIVTGCAEVVGVLATGEGKSLAFLLPACLPRAGTTVVVVPLVALKQDMTRRCQESELSYAIWNANSDRHPHHIGIPLLFVSVEQAVRARFRAFLGQLDAIGALARIVFDEAHLVLTAVSYRPKMSLVRHLRQLSCQVVFLTATLPPLLQSQFEERLLLKDPRVIRSRSFRPDITYRIRHSSDANLLEYVCRTVTSMLHHYRHDPDARLLVYTITRPDADDVSERLGCPKYYSDSGDASEKARAMQTWRDGHRRVLVATSAFGMGIDFPSVRQVIHMGAPTDMIGFAQEVGRLSRDGHGGFSRVILRRGWRSPGLPSVVDQRRSDISPTAMSVYTGDNRCLSAVLSRFLDGADRMQYCTQADAQLRCTKCAQHGLFDAQQETDDTVWWDPASGQGQLLESSDDDDPGDSDPGDFAIVADGRSVPRPRSIPSGGGGARLRVHLREVATGRDRYEEGLNILQGRCMICMILAPGQVRSAE